MSDVDSIMLAMMEVSNLMALFDIGANDGGHEIVIDAGLQILTRVYNRLENELKSEQLLEEFEDLDID